MPKQTYDNCDEWTRWYEWRGPGSEYGELISGSRYLTFEDAMRGTEAKAPGARLFYVDDSATGGDDKELHL